MSFSKKRPQGSKFYASFKKISLQNRNRGAPAGASASNKFQKNGIQGSLRIHRSETEKNSVGASRSHRKTTAAIQHTAKQKRNREKMKKCARRGRRQNSKFFKKMSAGGGVEFLYILRCSHNSNYANIFFNRGTNIFFVFYPLPCCLLWFGANFLKLD